MALFQIEWLARSNLKPSLNNQLANEAKGTVQQRLLAELVRLKQGGKLHLTGTTGSFIKLLEANYCCYDVKANYG